MTYNFFVFKCLNVGQLALKIVLKSINRSTKYHTIEPNRVISSALHFNIQNPSLNPAYGEPVSIDDCLVLSFTYLSQGCRLGPGQSHVSGAQTGSAF